MESIQNFYNHVVDKQSQLSTKQRAYLMGIVGCGAVAYYVHQNVKEAEDKELHPEKYKKLEEKAQQHKKFMTQLKAILKIVFPSVYSKEFGLLLMHTGVLLAKTFLSLYIATLDGSIVKALVDRKISTFFSRVGLWMIAALPASYLTSLIIYLEKKLSIALRTRLSKHAYELYMNNQTYYSVSNLDTRLTNADQCLTEDVKMFCDLLAHVHSQLSKPILDIVLNIWELSALSRRDGNGSGLTSFVVGFFVVYGTNMVLKATRPSFGKLVSEQAELEGKLRWAHSRLITNSEEVAFYRGDKVEHGILMKSYMSLAKHMNTLFKARIFYTVMEQFLMKYWWAAAGTTLTALPAFLYERSEKVSSEVVSNRTQSYITAKNLLVFGASAIERIMLANKEISELSGYTDRVSTMLQVFNDCDQGKYVKAKVANITVPKGKLISDADYIEFDKVSIITPNGDILVKALSFKILRGQHLLIQGPNGCGKSSLFRMLGELWPVWGGTLTKPKLSNMFYIPQRPYCVIGTFLDQIIYPDTKEDMLNKGFKENDIEEICKWADLYNIVEKEGFEAQRDWNELLSGGEKQKMGLARLFYHKPAFAILDECTSNLNMELEGKLYQQAMDLGITLITVTHRPSLWKYHNYLLQFDGTGNVNFSDLNSMERLTLKEEKGRLEEKLLGVTKMEARLKTLYEMLGDSNQSTPVSTPNTTPFTTPKK